MMNVKEENEMKIKEFIVVEGKSDTDKIKQAVQADTIETNGSAINQETLTLLKYAQKQRGIIVFTDPDFQGERIRSIIQQHVPQCKHAFLPKEYAIPLSKRKRSVGIEHATIEHIRQALRHVYTPSEVYETEIEQADLLKYGLLGQAYSKARRKQLGLKLFIGQTNGKQLLKRLKQFQISKSQFVSAMEEVIKEEEQRGK